MPIASTQLAEIQALYDRGLYLQAYRLCEPLGPLAKWRGPAARVLAGRLANQLGSPRLGEAMHLRAWREDPTHPDAVYYAGRVVFVLQGPLPALAFIAKHEKAAGATDEQRAHFLSFHAGVRASLRDFDTADALVERAVRLDPGNGWIHSEHAWILEQEDRYEDSLAAAQRGLSVEPGYPPAVNAAAHACVLLGRDDEAVALLTEAVNRTESAHLALALADLQLELGRHAEAGAAFDRVVERWPLLDKRMDEWIAGRRSDVAYHAGDFEKAAELAGRVKQGFYATLATNLKAAPPDSRRVVLPVGFLRQHHNTCAPATLSNLGRFWRKPTDHLSLAEQICYNGTPAPSERRWAEDNGWIVREFRLTWDSAVALIDRGVPFTLTTIEPTNGHLQAIIGYDQRRGAFLIRDPYYRHLGEGLRERLLEHYAPVGPRAIAIVPRERAQMLDGIDLPDAELFDINYDLQRALLGHDRASAKRAAELLASKAPDHRLTHESRLSLAYYDEDPAAQLEAIEALLRLYPQSPVWLLRKAGRLRHFNRWDEHRELLEKIVARPDCDAVFLSEYAVGLSNDARRWEEALRVVTRAVHRTRGSAPYYNQMGNALWDLRRQAEALDAYRAAMTLDDKEERWPHTYFVASRFFKRTAETLALLERRFERFGKRSAGPVQTLFWAREAVDEVHDGFASLDKALELRPDDGELMLFSAEANARWARFARAGELLKLAEGKCKRSHWLRAAGRMALFRGELARSLGCWRQVLELEPVALDAHHHVVARLEELEGKQAVLAHLDAAVARFPYHHGLNELRSGWLSREDPERAETALRELIKLNPQNAWAHRELAVNLAQQRRLEEALACTAEPLRLDPLHPATFNIHGWILVRLGRGDEAREVYTAAIRHSVDNDDAIRWMLGLCRTREERRAALTFVREELVKQVTFGDGLLAFREQATDTLAPDETLATLREAHAARPDLWHAWSALMLQLAQMGRLDEAAVVAEQACDRFPLRAKLWLDRGEIYRLRSELNAELDSLRQALVSAPTWTVPMRKLAEAYMREGRFDEAKRTAERMVACEPLDGVNHGFLADALWALGEKEKALEHLQRAVSLLPDYRWAWDRMGEWSAELGKPELKATLARDVAKRRPGEARSWMLLAHTLRVPDDLNEVLAALDKAIELEPRNAEAHDQRARILADSGRLDEALAACRPAALGESRPLELVGREIWVESLKGDRPRAIERMRELLRLDDAFMWGWHCVQFWCREEGDHAGALEAAKRMSELRPDDPHYLLILARAKLAAGDRPGAIAALRRALALAPEYAEVGYELFALQLADDRIADAAQTVERMAPHIPPVYAHTLREQVACAEHDPDAMRRHLHAMLASPAVDTWALNRAADAMDKASSGRVMNDALLRACLDGAANADTVRAAIRRFAKATRWGDVRRVVKASRGKGDAERHALGVYVETLGEHKMGVRLYALILLRRSELRATTVLWAQVGYALYSAGQGTFTRLWLRDWREREGVRPWMLLNLSLSLRDLWRFRTALAVNEAAVKLPDDHATPWYLVWVALDRITKGGLGEAATLLDRIGDSKLDGEARLVRDLARLLVDYARDTAEPVKAYRAAKQLWARVRLEI